MNNEENPEVMNPVLSSIIELNNSGVASIKGDIGNDCARALNQVYKKEIDPASGYMLESMQIDQQLKKAVFDSIVAEKDYYTSREKHYTLVYAIDPVTIAPVDLIDFKAAANETVNDPGEDSDMVIYIEQPQTESVISPAMEAVMNIAATNRIKTIHGIQPLIEYLKGL